MLTKIEYRDHTNWCSFWTSCPGEFPEEGGYSHGGKVSGDELIAEVWRAEEAYCGDGDSCGPDELQAFERWLEDVGYSVDVAHCATKKLAGFMEEGD